MMTHLKQHNRKLGLCGTAMTLERSNRYEFEVMPEIQDELEHIMIKADYLENAPFEWVTVSIRFGLKNEDVPHFGRINEKYGDIPLSIEVDVRETKGLGHEMLKEKLMKAVLKALIATGKKYDLPIDLLEERYNQL